MSLFNKSKTVFPMPRSAFVLLLLSVVLSVFPHLERVPSWMWLVFVAILLWRIQVFRQRANFPQRLLRFSLVSFAFVGVVFHHGTIFGPEAGVGLLITAYLFKQLEMYTKRDAFLVVILSYFVLATEFLFSRSLWSSLYIFFVLVVITAALIALNQTESRIAVWHPFRTALKFLMQAVPLLLVLFFLFPRIGPIWNLNLNSKSTNVGLSDRVSPGDIANLSRSEKLAFRAEFQGAIPSQPERYWRAVVFDRFDGKTWYAVDPANQSVLKKDQINVDADRSYRYRVYLESTGQNWLMAMPWASLSGVIHSPTQNLMHYSKDKIDSPISYEVVSYPDYQAEPYSLSQMDSKRFTQLPNNSNPLAQQFARKLFKQSGYQPEAFSDRLLSIFFQEEFVYTLSPPRLQGDTIDEFLFSTRRGFCSHYAGAYVFLMRSLGIPARMVGGYQGGELHPIGKYLLIHQYDAHAWAEYWVRGKGWVRVDPTAAVAPHRIESGPMSLSSELSFLRDSPLSPEKLRNLAIFSRLRLMADYVDYLWFKNVVSFDKDQQSQLFKQILGEVTPRRIAILIAVVGGGVLLLMLFFIAINQRNAKPVDPVDRAYYRYLRMLQKKGLRRELGEGPNDFSVRVLNVYPKEEEKINIINNLYNDLKYKHNLDEVQKDTKASSKFRPKSGSIHPQIKQLEAAIKQLKLK